MNEPKAVDGTHIPGCPCARLEGQDNHCSKDSAQCKCAVIEKAQIQFPISHLVTEAGDAPELCDVCGQPLVFPADDDPQFAGDTAVTSTCRHMIQQRNVVVGDAEIALPELKTPTGLARNMQTEICHYTDTSVYEFRDAALRTINRLTEELKESQEEVLTNYEYSTVANWRSRQVESAIAAGIEFTEPGITCVNRRAESAEQKMAKAVEVLNEGDFGCDDEECDTCPIIKSVIALLTSETIEKGSGQ